MIDNQAEENETEANLTQIQNTELNNTKEEIKQISTTPNNTNANEENFKHK